MAKVPDDDAVVVMATVEVARALELSSTMIRKYARKGRIKPFAITLGGQRLYEAKEAKRLAAEIGRPFKIPAVPVRRSS